MHGPEKLWKLRLCVRERQRQRQRQRQTELRSPARPGPLGSGWTRAAVRAEERATHSAEERATHLLAQGAGPVAAAAGGTLPRRGRARTRPGRFTGPAALIPEAAGTVVLAGFGVVTAGLVVAVSLLE